RPGPGAGAAWERGAGRSCRHLLRLDERDWLQVLRHEAIDDVGFAVAMNDDGQAVIAAHDSSLEEEASAGPLDIQGRQWGFAGAELRPALHARERAHATSPRASASTAASSRVSSATS